MNNPFSIADAVAVKAIWDLVPDAKNELHAVILYRRQKTAYINNLTGTGVNINSDIQMHAFLVALEQKLIKNSGEENVIV